MDTLSHIEALNARCGITGKAEVMAGNGGLPVVRITTPAVEAEISLYGAQVTRWKPTGAEEVLFLSQKSYWEAGHAIRGGVPVCFPWFGDKADDPSAPKHGLVRTREWHLDSLSAMEDGSVTLVCTTESDATTRPLWPHEYGVVYRITVGAKMQLELTVMNRGKTPMRFEEALHSYLRVGDVQDMAVRGLDGITYLDKTDAFREKMQPGDVTISAETDRVFLNTRGPVDVVDNSLGRTVRTEKANSETTVVWNPWREQAAKLPDFADDEWRQMVAVEGSNVQAAAIRLGPGDEHTMRITLSSQPVTKL